MRRRSAATFWTVSYGKYIVGNQPTMAALVQHMIDYPEKYPTGGKLVEIAA